MNLLSLFFKIVFYRIIFIKNKYYFKIYKSILLRKSEIKEELIQDEINNILDFLLQEGIILQNIERQSWIVNTDDLSIAKNEIIAITLAEIQVIDGMSQEANFLDIMSQKANYLDVITILQKLKMLIFTKALITIKINALKKANTIAKVKAVESINMNNIIELYQKQQKRH